MTETGSDFKDGEMPVAPSLRPRLLQHLEHVRLYFLQRQNHCCWYCGVEFSSGTDAPELDHMTPLVRGGADAMRNLVMACAYCNGEKGRRTVEEYRAEIICRHSMEPDYLFPGERERQ